MASQNFKQNPDNLTWIALDERKRMLDGFMEASEKLDPHEFQWWRLNNLYAYKPKEGGLPRLFKAWPMQEKLFRERWLRNVVLKCRGIGSTTFWCLYCLDSAMFYPGTSVALVAHTEDEAQALMIEKVNLPYNNFPLFAELAPHFKFTLAEGTQGSQSRLMFANGSSIRVVLKLDSGSYQIILNTEFGPLAADRPDQASDFRRAGLPTIRDPERCFIIVESTAKGTSGEYCDLCNMARQSTDEVQAGVRKQDAMDWKFMFIAWHDDPSKIRKTQYPVSKELADYFDELEVKHKIKLTDQQKWWYAATKEEQGADHMSNNYPSTPDEAFKASLQGCYYTQELTAARKDGRISKFKYDPRYPVDTWWDIGLNDSNAIWCSQTVGNVLHFIWYYENDGESFDHYADYLKTKVPWPGTRYRFHVGPHDLMKRDYMTRQTVWASAARMGFRFEYVEKPKVKADAIQAVRMFLRRCCFDVENCALGIEHLENYRKEWDKARGVFRDRPRHDAHSHCNDALQTCALYHDRILNGALTAGMSTEVRIESGPFG